MGLESAAMVEGAREALRMAILLAAAPLLAALLVGLVVGIGQTLTQMHEPTVGLVTRLLAVAAVVLIALPWLIGQWVGYAAELFRSIPDALGP